MSSNYTGFISESAKIHTEYLTEQSRISEDVNKYTTWILGLSTAGIGILIVQFRSIVNYSWVGMENVKIYLIATAVLLFISIILGAFHQIYSIIERNCYRFLIVRLSKQRLIPYVVQPEESPEELPDDLHDRVSRGLFLGMEDQHEVSSMKNKAGKLRKILDKTFKIQQILAGISYVLLFVLAIPK